MAFTDVINTIEASVQQRRAEEEARLKKGNILSNALLAGGASYLTGGLASGLASALMGGGLNAAAFVPNAAATLNAVKTGFDSMGQTTDQALQSGIQSGIKDPVEAAIAKAKGLIPKQSTNGQTTYGIPVLSNTTHRADKPTTPPAPGYEYVEIYHGDKNNNSWTTWDQRPIPGYSSKVSDPNKNRGNAILKAKAYFGKMWDFLSEDEKNQKIDDYLAGKPFSTKPKTTTTNPGQFPGL